MLNFAKGIACNRFRRGFGTGGEEANRRAREGTRLSKGTAVDSGTWGPLAVLFGGAGGAPVWTYVYGVLHSGVRKRGFAKANSIAREAFKKGPNAVWRAGSSLCYCVSAKARKRSPRVVFAGWRHLRSKNIKRLPRRPPKRGRTSFCEVPFGRPLRAPSVPSLRTREAFA